ncbi:MAG: c-type cytochrome [Halobacteriovoraceae bacterium]|jgi:cytochrome c553|nr:c-type cytochrome [Halobacteriovoraceae bacterium]MBT5095469.1 c-type cytochrome [Halobacteriovoraceae bacterium]
MKLTLLLLVLLSGLYSCAEVNTQARDHYYKNKPFRHGIVPISISAKSSKGRRPRINKAAAKRGKILYKNNCYSCHGQNGAGNGPQAKNLDRIPRNLVKMAKQVPNFKFYMLVSQWKGDMPGWKNALSKADVRDLENYIRQLALLEK